MGSKKKDICHLKSPSQKKTRRLVVRFSHSFSVGGDAFTPATYTYQAKACECTGWWDTCA